MESVCGPLEGKPVKITNGKKIIETGWSPIPSLDSRKLMTCDQVILWAIESFELAHLIREHGYQIIEPAGITNQDLSDCIAEEVFEMHRLLFEKCAAAEKK